MFYIEFPQDVRLCSLEVGEINMNKIPILYNRKEECCGCTACYAVCANNAISMTLDEKGFEYPTIDEEKCICCYQCIKACPIKGENKRV